MKPSITDQIQECSKVIAALAAQEQTILKAGTVMSDSLRNGGKLLTCGNGGSAAEALHLAEELIGKYKKPRRSLAAISLNADPTTLTCIGNDFGFDEVFSRQIEGLGKPGDVLVIFTSSGNSKNLLEAIRKAREQEVKVIALLGKGGGAAKGLSDIEIIIPSDVTARIQEAHQLLLHLFLEIIEDQLGLN